MFLHNLKYSLKILFRSKQLIFWTFAFPIILGLFFNMAFKDIEKNEKLDIIDIAVVNNSYYKNDDILKKSLKELGNKKSKNQIFNIKYTSLSKSKKLLSSDKIIGYLLINENGTNITVKRSGIDETIFRFVIDEVNITKEIFKNVIKNYNVASYQNTNIDYKKIYNDVLQMMNKKSNIKDISSKNLSYTMIEYYTLIAMACLYGGIISMYITNKRLANMNSVGKRTSTSCINKGSMLLSSLLASYIVQLLGLLLLFIFTIFIINVDYGTNLLYVLLISLVGSFAGLSFGVFVATTFKKNETVKIGILISITMLFCLLSGMMGITLKYVIDKNIPILNIINPASMITDGFYSLYYYDTINRFRFDIISLIMFSIIMILISYKRLRREKYDSI